MINNSNADEAHPNKSVLVWLSMAVPGQGAGELLRLRGEARLVAQGGYGLQGGAEDQRGYGL